MTVSKIKYQNFVSRSIKCPVKYLIHKAKIETIGKNISDKDVVLACLVFYFATRKGKKEGTNLSTLTVSKKKINATFFCDFANLWNQSQRRSSKILTNPNNSHKGSKMNKRLIELEVTLTNSQDFKRWRGKNQEIQATSKDPLATQETKLTESRIHEKNPLKLGKLVRI